MTPKNWGIRRKNTMIDNIVIVAENQNIPIEILNHLKTDKQQTDHNSYYGHFKNIRFKQSAVSVTLTGSIAKYLNGQNIQDLTKKEIETALKTLEKDTGLNFEKAILRRIEVGKSIILHKPIPAYLSLFDWKPTYTKSTHGKASIETVSYSTKTGAYSFIAYDKIAEMKNKDIPDLYKDCNVVRLEYKIKRLGIKKEFKKDLRPYDLTDKNILQQLYNLFCNFYSSIPKTGRGVFIDKTEKITPKELNDRLADAFRQKHPEDYASILKQINITAKNRERIRAIDRKNSRDFTTSDINELTHELDEKVLNTYGYKPYKPYLKTDHAKE